MGYCNLTKILQGDRVLILKFLFCSILPLVLLLGSYLPYIHVKPISRIFQTMANSAGKDCQSAYFVSCVDLSTIVVCSDEFLTDRDCVMSKNGLKMD